MRSKARNALVVGLAIALAATGVAALLSVRRGEPARETLAALWGAFGGVRPIEGRLAGPTAYARYEPRPIPGPRRGRAGEAPAFQPESIDVLRATADIFEEHSRAPSTETARRVAGANLLRGDAEGAAAALDAVRRDAPVNALILSDLAAAYLEQARVEDRPVLIVEALECVEQAVEVDPSLVEARFNRAVVLERLHLVAPARAAWVEYVALDPGSEWAGEAERRIAALDERPTSAAWPAARERLRERAAANDAVAVRELAREFPHFCRMLARNELFAEWADAEREGRAAEASVVLEACRAIGAELESLQGDNFLRDAVAAIDRGAPLARAAIVEGHWLSREARAAASDGRFADAVALHARAAASFARGGDAANRLASQRNQADADYVALNGPRALALVLRVKDEAAALGYPQIEGVAWWLVGTIRLRERALVDAQRAFEVALERLERAQFVEGTTIMHGSLGDVHAELGQYEAASFHFASGLSILRRFVEPNQRTNLLNALTVMLAHERRFRAALTIQNESVRVSQETGDACDAAAERHLRALILLRLGRSAAAAEDIAVAWGRLDEIPVGPVRQRIDGDLMLAEVEAGLIADAAATAACDRAQAIYEKAGDRTRSLRSLLLRARSRLRLGDPRAAEADLRAAVDEVLRVREAVPDVNRRISFLDAPRAVFDEMIAFQCSTRSDPETALAYLEANRARGLLDLLGANAGALAVDRAATTRIRSRLAPGCVLVEFAWTDTDLYAWAVDRNGVAWRRLEAPVDMRRTIAHYQEALSRGRWDAATEEASRRLYDALVRPLEGEIAEASHLVLVPDEELWDVPFATLSDRADGRFLVEKVALTTAPSAEVFLHAAERDGRLARAPGDERALVAGDPAVDPNRFSSLPALEDAAREARAVASLYPAATVVLGANATKATFLHNLGSASVAHFAGHALSQGRRMPEPGLLFAGESRSETLDDVLLGASEIARLRLPSTRLVVLAACRTGAGARVGREGNLSVARAWLAAGVPCVAATLWDVEDRAAGVVLTEFHRRRRAGDAPGRALQAALVAAINSPDPEMRSPAAWGAFYLLGGHGP